MFFLKTEIVKYNQALFSIFQPYLTQSLK